MLLRGGRQTEWVLLTSGTTGAPKLVSHNVASLTAPIKAGTGAPPVWGTFYDIRRYGGLQIFFRAVIGGGSLVLSSAGEPVADHLARLAAHGVTHVSGTPSHWWRVLMGPAARTIAPRYVRLSGEIADQTMLDNLHAVYPQAGLGHAYASTEAGVGFEVDDGLEGFPAHFVDDGNRDVDIKIVGGSLRLRSARTASRYIGAGVPALMDGDGFVDTGDIVERRGERYYFVGRKDGIINVGGLKVHPEEVEAAINRHAGVWGSLVKSRKSPITGAIVVADVVLKARPDGATPARGWSLWSAKSSTPAAAISRPQGAGPDPLRAGAADVGDRQARAPCVTSSSPAAAAVSASRSRSSSRKPAIAPSRSRARRAAN